MQQLLPQQQQQVLQLAQQHIQQHQQALAQKAQGGAQRGGGGGSPGGDVRERDGQEGNIISMVRSNAQEMSQQLQRAPGQN